MQAPTVNSPGNILSDSQVRPALRSHLLSAHVREADTVIIEELGVCRGQVRIDLAVVNGLLHGYEIKSDRDSLRRLSGQTDYYGRVLDRATLVVGDRHLTAALDIVPAWWGVLCIRPTLDGIQFKVLRRGRKNPRREARSLVELLWLDDAVALLDGRDVARGVRSKPRQFVWDKVCEHFNLEEISAAVRDHLKARATTPRPRPR